jgi:NAD-dependent dihydropyrimidine dehydrogenase PreA subunit
MVSIVVDKEKCDGCGECVDICPAEVYAIEEGKSVPVNIEECTECCSCVEVCPPEAIEHGSC